MKIERLTHSPGTVADFYEEALTSLGALCERTWHDRLEVVAEGNTARLWNDTGALHEVELWFPPPEGTAPREAAKEVFPGCPLTFRLAEALRPTPLALDRVVLAGNAGERPPPADVAEKLWRSQFPETNRWQLASPFVAERHFSLLALMRCEIQAIDQHWSLRRVVVSLPDGAPDDSLARSLDLAQVATDAGSQISCPTPDPMRCREFLRGALAEDLAFDLAAIRDRQSHHLRRELDRVDDYFEHYEQELAARAARAGNESTKLKTAGRLAAAKAEHARRRADQVARHEIRAHAHLDSLLLISESAWRAGLTFELSHRSQTASALFVPRARRWIVVGEADGK
jgi:hypothetical protein